jgi:hypothetical protein
MSLLLCITIALVWARSFWRPMTMPFMRHGEACRVLIDGGAVSVDNDPQYLSDLANHHRDIATMELIGGNDLMAPPPWRGVTRWGWASVWLLPLAAMGFGAGALMPMMFGVVRRRLRRTKSLCTQCGYDLTGNVSGVCPECGKICCW